MQKKQYIYDKYSPSLGTHNHEHQSRWTIRQQRASSITKYNPNEQRQWICASTGCATAKHRGNLGFIGGREDQPHGQLYQPPPPHAPCQCQVRISYQNQRSYRRETSESGTRTDQIQVSQQLNSYKGVLDFLVRYVSTEATYDS